MLTKQANYGLIGADTSYSLSPIIHESAANQLRLHCTYMGFSLKVDQVQAFLETFLKEGGQGLNITNPYKKMVASLLGPKEELRPVNTLVRRGSKWEAYSTDGEGFYRALLRADQDLNSFAAVCFLGAGDVVQSILSYIAPYLNNKSVYILRRNSKNDKLLQKVYSNSSFLSFTNESLLEVVNSVSGKILLVQASSAPNQGDDLAYLEEALLDFNGFYYDLIYGKPACIYHSLQERGIPVLDGLSMLIEQALLAQKLWWGESGSYELIENKIKGHG